MLTTTRFRLGIAAGLATLTVLTSAAAPAAAAPANPRVLPPTGAYAGSTSANWSEAWWRWAVARPAAQSALADNTGANCAVDQTGPVWFLAGTTGGTATRTCTIPAGKAILFPVFNVEWSAAEALDPKIGGGGCFVPGVPAGTSEAALSACAAAQIDHVTSIEASVDGVPIGDLRQYRARSGLFTFNAADGNAAGIPAGTTSAVADGYWILLAPLSPGSHTIHFSGVATFPELGFFTFQEGADYALTIGQP